MTEIFALLSTLPDVPKPLNKLPGCYERDLPNGWHVSVNAHKEERRSGHGHRARVPPFHAVFTHAETLECACISPFDGTTLGGDAVEGKIIEALEAAGAKP